jgi:hypothetical protein
MRRTAIVAVVVVVGALAGAVPAGAHRLDEYLQATRVSIDRDAVSIEIDLTPGATIASAVFATIDANGDGEIGGDEAQAYARRVLDAVTLSVDGRPAALRLTASQFPTLVEMRAGLGTIRLSARATALVSGGAHRVEYVNRFSPEISVYLANTVVPPDDRIEIAELHRDWLQRSFAIDYRVNAGPLAGRFAWSIAAAMMGILIGCVRFKSDRPAARVQHR